MEYNAFTDFSTTENPNGVWEYLAAGAVMTAHLSSDGAPGWDNGLTLPDEAWMVRDPTSTTIQNGGLTYRTDHLHLDPQGIANVSVQFTAPNTGIFDFTGDFIGDDMYGSWGPHPVEILVNGSPVYSNTISAYDQSDAFNIQETLTAGDTVNFAVDTGYNGNYAFLGTELAVIVESNAVHWVAGSANFNTTTDWNPSGIPGATDDVAIDAAGTYTVTASTSETVDTLAVAANATLVVSAGTFTVSNGSGAGGLAGSIILDAGAVLALAGLVTNDGTIAGAGQVGNGGSLSLVNAAGAVIDANQAAALVLSTTGGVSNAGLIEATDTAAGNGGLVVQNTTIDNAGGTVAANGTHAHVDLSGATIIGGVLSTSGGGVIQTAAGANGVLDGLDDGALTNSGLVSVTDSTSLALLGSIVNTGTLGVAASTAGNTDLQIGSPVVTLSGGGTVLLSSNAGNRIIGTAAADQLVNSNNTIAGGGQLGAGALAFSNGGTVNADASVGLTIDLGGQAGQNLAGGLIEATGAGGLTIASGTVSNAGTMLAADGGTLTFQSGVVNTNNTGGVLSWGTFEQKSGVGWAGHVGGRWQRLHAGGDRRRGDD